MSTTKKKDEEVGLVTGLWRSAKKNVLKIGSKRRKEKAAEKLKEEKAAKTAKRRKERNIVTGTKGGGKLQRKNRIKARNAEILRKRREKAAAKAQENKTKKK
tara:strand:+ start:136 stop:441 length:306 start_codon:yes stop_codon:yes gene_type:complete